MLVLNLCCGQGHGFEGWFGSAADFESQLAKSQLSCPLCNSTQIQRLPSAPRLNVSHLRREAPSPPARARAQEFGPQGQPRANIGSTGPGSLLAAQSTSGNSKADASEAAPSSDGAVVADTSALQAQALNAMRKLMAQTENVGGRFAEEARRIHYGEVQARSIRGQASHAEAMALLEEGVAVLPLPNVPGLTEPLQ